MRQIEVEKLFIPFWNLITCYCKSYDFLHLNKHEDCSVQLGGDDHWSNMLGGMDLIRRKERKQVAFCLTVPLLYQVLVRKWARQKVAQFG